MAKGQRRSGAPKNQDAAENVKVGTEPVELQPVVFEENKSDEITEVSEQASDVSGLDNLVNAVNEVADAFEKSSEAIKEATKESSINTGTAEITASPHAHTISTGSVVFLTNQDAAENVKVLNVVKVRIQYPDNYTGNKRLKNGKVYEVSPATAEILIAKGIAKLIE